MHKVLVDRTIAQAASLNHEYVVQFSRPDGETDQRLEFLESYRDYYEMVRGKSFWKHYDQPYQTDRVWDVDYWIERV